MPQVSEMLASPSWLAPKNETPEWLAKGAALGERRHEFDILQNRLREIDALTTRAKDQEYELQAIKLRNEIFAREKMVQSEGAYTKIAAIYGQQKIAGIAGTDDGMGRIHSAIANDPSFYSHPGAKDLLAEMKLSEKDRTLTETYNRQMERIGFQEGQRTYRTELTGASREAVAGIRAGATVESARIRAEAVTTKAIEAASKWKDHLAFAAVKEKLPRLAALHQDDDVYAAEVIKLYETFLPPGEANELSAVPAAVAPPVATSVNSDEMVPVIRPDGIPGMMPRKNLERAFKAGYKEAK